MKKRLLITGFDPFGGSAVNPSWMAVEQLPDEIAGFVLCKLQLPTVFGKAAAIAIDKIDEVKPDIVLCIGLAGNRTAVTPERIAVNIRDARIADNEGNLPSGEYVIPDGSAAYFSTVPVEKMVQAIQDISLPAAVSNTAGTFVCNDLLYNLLHHCNGTATKVGFIHVPNIPKLGEPSLPLQAICSALTAAISVCDHP